MSRRRLRLAICAGAAALAVGGGAVAAVAATSPPAGTATGTLTASFSKDSDWATGYQARYTITNTGAGPVTGWTLDFGLPAGAKLASSWEATVTTSGATSSAKDRGYNGTIAARGSTTFGSIVNGSGAPTTCTINGANCGSGGSIPASPAAPASPSKSPSSAPATKPPVSTAPTTKAPVATSAPATTTPPSPNSDGVRVAPYVDMGLLSNGSTTLEQLAESGGVKSFSLAFVTSTGCKASWFNAFDPRSGQFKDQIEELRKAGGDIKVSFGGATGTELAQACTDIKALQAEYQAVVDAYDLNYIDLDIEGSAAADQASIARRSTALAALQKANPGLKISLTLPVLPEGLTTDGMNVVKSAKDAGVDLDLVNIMAMDYGRAAQDYGDLAIQAVTSTKNQIKSLYGIGDAAAFAKVGVTPMLGRNDDNGTFTQSDARDVVAFANANSLGFVSYWEVNRDKNACDGALFQCTNVSQAPFEFSKIFAGFTG